MVTLTDERTNLILKTDAPEEDVVRQHKRLKNAVESHNQSGGSGLGIEGPYLTEDGGMMKFVEVNCQADINVILNALIPTINSEIIQDIETVRELDVITENQGYVTFSYDPNQDYYTEPDR